MVVRYHEKIRAPGSTEALYRDGDGMYVSLYKILITLTEERLSTLLHQVLHYS